MRELIERLIWFLTYKPGMDVPIPPKLAGKAIAEWATLKYGPATAAGENIRCPEYLLSAGILTDEELAALKALLVEHEPAKDAP